MSEHMLVDASKAYDLQYVILRYFNVAGADPAGRLGQSTPGATHLIRQAPRRAGDPASIVANSHQLMKLGWEPELNDLPTMIEHAHDWQKS
jgi:UDP-glucose 4-epimerase